MESTRHRGQHRCAFQQTKVLPDEPFREWPGSRDQGALSRRLRRARPLAVGVLALCDTAPDERRVPLAVGGRRLRWSRIVTRSSPVAFPRRQRANQPDCVDRAPWRFGPLARGVRPVVELSAGVPAAGGTITDDYLDLLPHGVASPMAADARGAASSRLPAAAFVSLWGRGRFRPIVPPGGGQDWRPPPRGIGAARRVSARARPRPSPGGAAAR